MGWEFHFRNLSPVQQWFAVYHAGCVGVPWHTGRPKCWDAYIDHNPTGGGGSVYPPNALVADFATLLKDVEFTVDEMFVDWAIFLGRDCASFPSAIEMMVEVYDLEMDILEVFIKNANLKPEAVITAAQQGFANACQQINQPQETVIQYAEKLGLGSSGWGFISGQSYQRYIYSDNSLNEDFGWTVLTSSADASSPQMIANAAFVWQGKLVYMYDPENSHGFWYPF
jgi:hypothetical protein